MKTRFVSVDRNQPMSVPPDLRDWIPKDDWGHFVIKAVEGMDLATFDFRPRPTEEKKPPEIRSAFVLDMKKRMERDESRAKYRLRKQTVEPIFGTIKKWMGFTQFLLRGHEKVSGEWQLVSLAYNMKRLWPMRASAIGWSQAVPVAG